MARLLDSVMAGMIRLGLDLCTLSVWGLPPGEMIQCAIFPRRAK